MSSRAAVALRKNLLVMRAAVERAELAESVIEVKRALRWSNLLKAAIPGLAASQGLPVLVQLLRRYPIVSTVFSFVTSRFARRGSGRGRRGGLLAWIVVAGLAWQGVTLVRSLRTRSAERRHREERALDALSDGRVGLDSPSE